LQKLFWSCQIWFHGSYELFLKEPYQLGKITFSIFRYVTEDPTRSISWQATRLYKTQRIKKLTFSHCKIPSIQFLRTALIDLFDLLTPKRGSERHLFLDPCSKVLFPQEILFLGSPLKTVFAFTL
jgi:hypothetical protein